MRKPKHAKPSAPKMPKIKRAEKEQVHARRELGHGFGLRIDEFGRERLVAGTMEATRIYEISNGGYVALGGVARIRNVDPLKGISSLNDDQRNAARQYRDVFEYASREGMKTGSMQERVDGGRINVDTPQRLAVAHASLSSAREKIGHWEIALVIDKVVCEGMSLRELAETTGDPREALVKLLKIGLDNLAVFFRITRPPPEKKSAKTAR
ncbi:hypothetical protein NKI80_07280 [Mesorhizobium sp. M0387]|uniref:hypothetical protein n=1 Tax=Mesorhizobium sp. M0387 TaxID=2956940 RepID=UPI0033397282